MESKGSRRARRAVKQATRRGANPNTATSRLSAFTRLSKLFTLILYITSPPRRPRPEAWDFKMGCGPQPLTPLAYAWVGVDVLVCERDRLLQASPGVRRCLLAWARPSLSSVCLS